MVQGQFSNQQRRLTEYQIETISNMRHMAARKEKEARRVCLLSLALQAASTKAKTPGDPTQKIAAAHSPERTTQKVCIPTWKIVLLVSGALLAEYEKRFLRKISFLQERQVP